MSTMRVRRARLGLTLIELVVVMAILVGLAGMLVPQLSGILKQSGYAGAAATTTDVMNNLGTFQATTGSYPQNLDSLIDTGGTGIDSGVWNGPSGMPQYALYNAASPFGNMAYYMSFAQTFGTSYTVMDFASASTATAPNQGGTIARPITEGGTDTLALVSSSNTTLQAAAGFPNGLTLADSSTVELVVMGVGPQCAAVGQTMSQAPMCSTQTSNLYGRYLAVFALYSNGKPATLQTVVDSQGNSSAADATSFKSAVTNAASSGTTTTGSGTTGM